MKNNFVTLTLLLLVFLPLGFSQENLTNELEYEVNRIYPYISITKKNLNKAHTINDFKNEINNLNLEYKASWVREYISVEILTSCKGRIKKAVSKTDILSQEQKDIMNMADVGTDISVTIQYIPENTLTHNEIKKINFTLTVNPEKEAKYPGGAQQLKQYLKEKAIDKIRDTSFEGYDLAAVKFSINEEGQITDPHVFWSSKDKKIDELLLETICNMPNWKPAEYANGTKAKQEFVFTVGNMENCNINLLNIHKG